MKKVSLLLSAAISIAASVSVNADNTDYAVIPGGVLIVQDLQVEAIKPIAFPALVAPGDTPILNANEPDTSVAIVCDAAGAVTSVAYTGNGNPFAHGVAAATSADATSLNAIAFLASSNPLAPLGVTGQCAKADVTGSPNAHFIVDVATSTGSGVPNLAVTNLTCAGVTSSTNMQLDGTGNASIYCGAKLTASFGVVPNTVHAVVAGTVTVTYD